MNQRKIYKNQHCTSVDDCLYTMSHTANFCGTYQPRRCACLYCIARYDAIQSEASSRGVKTSVIIAAYADLIQS